MEFHTISSIHNFVVVVGMMDEKFVYFYWRSAKSQQELTYAFFLPRDKPTWLRLFFLY